MIHYSSSYLILLYLVMNSLFLYKIGTSFLRILQHKYTHSHLPGLEVDY